MRRRKADPDSEAAHQERVAEYLDGLDLLWCHVPNEGKRSPVTGAQLKRQGLKRGVPDILIFEACMEESPSMIMPRVGACIELKRPRATGYTKERGDRFRCSSVTPEQSQWLEDLDGNGWSCWVCFGFHEVVDLCRYLGYDKSVQRQPFQVGK